MNKTIPVFFIIAFNLAPVAGVIFFHWEPFEAFWFFWLETLIMAVFNSIRIVFSQGGQRLQGAHNSMHYHFGKAMNYLLIRIGIFIFYSIFIITFIGFVANSGDKINVVRTLLFQNRFFNLGLLISVLSQGYYLVMYFFKNDYYLKAAPDSYTAIFDGRQIIIHVAIIFGTVASMFMAKHGSFSNYSSAAIIGVFCICKCVAELVNRAVTV